MLKVMTLVGTRPEIIKLSRVIPELDKHFEHVLVHTGQNYDPQLKDVFFREMGIRKPDASHSWENTRWSPTYATACMMQIVDDSLRVHKPDAVLILGDTNSCVAAAYAAKRHKIPLFHMEAGNRCFDQRTPEEINRKIVDHLSDINMVYTEHARRNLLAEGVKPDTIVKTGSPMREVIQWYYNAIGASQILERLELKPLEYFVVSLHREETINERWRMADFLRTFRYFCRSQKERKILFSVHPRTRKEIDERIAENFDYGMFEPNVILHEPFGFLDYLKLQGQARCVLSDSGTLTEEASIMGFPAVALRRYHERPEGMDTSNTILCSMKGPDSIQHAAEMSTHQRTGATPDDYTPTDVARKVARTILSYTDFVNRTVWHK